MDMMLTLRVSVEELCLSLLVGSGDDELVLVLGRRPADGGDRVLEATDTQTTRVSSIQLRSCDSERTRSGQRTCTPWIP